MIAPGEMAFVILALIVALQDSVDISSMKRSSHLWVIVF